MKKVSPSLQTGEARVHQRESDALVPSVSSGLDAGSGIDTTVNGRRIMIARATWLVLTISAVLVFSQVAAMLGGDANWDLMNYHISNPYSVVEGRAAQDHQPAGIQSYINPTLDILLTYPYIQGNPMLATQMMGGVQGLNFVLLISIVLSFRSIFAGMDRRVLVAMAAAAGLLGMSGAVTVSEIGTSFADLTTAVAVVGGVLLALLSVDARDGSVSRRGAGAAGLALGIAVGAKLTNGPYLVALGVALMAYSGPKWARTAMAFGIGGAVGLALVHGWWSWNLWQETGNPVFPFFNRFFESPYYPNDNFSDRRFRPVGLAQTLAYPFWFSWNHQSAELRFFDLRFPIAYLILAWLGVVGLRRPPGGPRR